MVRVRFARPALSGRRSRASAIGGQWSCSPSNSARRARCCGASLPCYSRRREGGGSAGRRSPARRALVLRKGLDRRHINEAAEPTEGGSIACNEDRVQSRTLRRQQGVAPERATLRDRRATKPRQRAEPSNSLDDGLDLLGRSRPAIEGLKEYRASTSATGAAPGLRGLARRR